MDTQGIEKNLKDVSVLLKSLSNENRLLIVCILQQGEKCVGQLEKELSLSQSALSQHLARLRRDGLVNTRREAQTIYYSLKDGPLEKILLCLSTLYI